MREFAFVLRHRVPLLERGNEVHNQICDLLETASIKLSSVVTDLLGVSGRRIIEALIRGEDSPEVLSWKVRGRLREKEKLVKESLKGYFIEFHRSKRATLPNIGRQSMKSICLFLEESIAKTGEEVWWAEESV